MSDFYPREGVRFLPGDRFAGWDRQSPMDRLELSPQAGSRPWLLSMLGGQPDDLIPIPTNPMGEESDVRRTYEVWAWVIEMTLAWAERGQAGDLEIASLLLQEEEDSQDMEPYVSQAAQGGLGMVRLNGEVVYDGGSLR